MTFPIELIEGMSLPFPLFPLYCLQDSRGEYFLCSHQSQSCLIRVNDDILYIHICSKIVLAREHFITAINKCGHNTFPNALTSWSASFY